MPSRKKMEFRIGDEVGYYSKTYVRGTRRPGFAGRFQFSYRRNGLLLAKNDLRAWKDQQPTWTQEQIDRHLATHLGLANATGAALGGSLTEKNNPVLFADGTVIWADADQIRQPHEPTLSPS